MAFKYFFGGKYLSKMAVDITRKYKVISHVGEELLGGGEFMEDVVAFVRFFGGVQVVTVAEKPVGKSWILFLFFFCKVLN